MHIGLGPLLARDLVPMTVFIPQDSAFGTEWKDIADALLHPRHKRLFLAFLKSHFVPSADIAEKRAAVPTELTDAAVVGEPVRVGPHNIYRIRRLLGTVPLMHESSAGSAPAVSTS
jgi:hypothetical protein